MKHNSLILSYYINVAEPKDIVISVWLNIQDDTSQKCFVFGFCLFTGIESCKCSKYFVSVWYHFAKPSFLVCNIFCFSLCQFNCTRKIRFMFNRNSVFVNGLAARGHNLTVISPDRDKSPPNRVHYIHMDGLYNEFYEEIVKSAFIPHETNAFQAIGEFIDYMAVTCEGERKVVSATDILNFWGCEGGKVYNEISFYSDCEHNWLSIIKIVSGRFSIRFNYNGYDNGRLFVGICA